MKPGAAPLAFFSSPQPQPQQPQQMPHVGVTAKRRIVKAAATTAAGMRARREAHMVDLRREQEKQQQALDRMLTQHEVQPQPVDAMVIDQLQPHVSDSAKNLIPQHQLEQDIASISRFKLLTFLGAGGYGSVFLARRDFKDEDYMRLFALKCVTARGLFPNELRAGMYLSHPCLPSLYEMHSVDNERYYLAFEFMPGADLEMLCNDGDVVFAEKWFSIIILQILAALMYCHLNGVTHCDIKLENIIVFGENYLRAKLVDFGLCFFHKESAVLDDIWLRMQMPLERNIDIKHMNEHDAIVCSRIGDLPSDQLSETNNTRGTIGYMAPEIMIKAISDAKELPGADIYSLGALMYVALTGEYIVSEDDARNIVQRVSESTKDASSRRAALATDESFQELLCNIIPLRFNGVTWKYFDSQHACIDDPQFNTITMPPSRPRTTTASAQDGNCHRKRRKGGMYVHRSDQMLTMHCMDLISRMMHPVPSKRITMAELLAHPWTKRAIKDTPKDILRDIQFRQLAAHFTGSSGKTKKTK